MIALRLVLLAMLAATGLAVALSYNDIVRYLKMRAM